MGQQTVKRKFPPAALITTLAVLTFFASFAGVFSAVWVEKVYAGKVYPMISHSIGLVADAVPFSWLDVTIVGFLCVLVYSVRYRKWRILCSTVAGGYLWFFWTWGLNYHRLSLEQRLQLQTSSIAGPDVDRFAQAAAAELNRLYPLASPRPLDRPESARLAAVRVERVVAQIDGKDWPAASRVKRSVIAEGWFRIAGIEGMFNPFGHEPLVPSKLLNVELPFVMSHELAHVRGVPNEGDANLIALFATVSSDNPAFQYSGWLQLWMYLGNDERNRLLDPGPRSDLRAISERMRSQQVRWASNVQTAVLDAHLKANDIPEGIQSYSKFVKLAIATQDRWAAYR